MESVQKCGHIIETDSKARRLFVSLFLYFKKGKSDSFPSLFQLSDAPSSLSWKRKH